LCEWQSFLHRYVPVGILEVTPQYMNLRPERFCGRSDLETLMASEDSKDWIKLSEMVLGPAHESFSFIPK
jgi:tRNA-dihydrouridine synthase 3